MARRLGMWHQTVTPSQLKSRFSKVKYLYFAFFCVRIEGGIFFL